MLNFERASLTQKLTSMCLLATASALLVAYLAFAFSSVLDHRRAEQMELTTLAKVAAANSLDALQFNDRRLAGQVLAPAKSLDQMGRIVFNDYVDAVLCGFFMFVVIAVLVYGVRTALQANRNSRPSANETPYVPAPATAEVQ